MPLGAFKTAMLGAAGSGSANHFIGWWDWTDDPTGNFYRFLGTSNIAVNSDGDMAVNAQFRKSSGGSDYYLPLTVYINDDTTVKWNKTLGNTTSNHQSKTDPGGIGFDSNGDVWAVVNGTAGQSGWSTDGSSLANLGPLCFQKYSKTDGTMNVDRILYRAQNYQVATGTIATIGSNAIWITGESDSQAMAWGISTSDNTTNYAMLSANSPEGGSNLDQRGGGYGDNWSMASTAWRGIGGVYTYRPMLMTNAGTAFGQNYQLFYNSSASSTTYYGQDCDMDTSGNKYFVINHSSLTPGIIMKVTGTTSQSMTIDWQRAYEGSYSTKWYYIYAIKADSSGNTYTVGYVEATVDSFGGKHGFIQKHNSSGTLQWENMFTPVHSGTGKQSFVYDVDITDDEESIVVTGQLADNNNYEQLMVAKLPADGSGTGSYVTGTNAGTIKYYDGSSHISSTTHNLTTTSSSMNTGNASSQVNGATSVTSNAADSDLGTYRTQDI